MRQAFERWTESSQGWVTEWNLWAIAWENSRFGSGRRVKRRSSSRERHNLPSRIECLRSHGRAPSTLWLVNWTRVWCTMGTGLSITSSLRYDYYTAMKFNCVHAQLGFCSLLLGSVLKNFIICCVYGRSTYANFWLHYSIGQLVLKNLGALSPSVSQASKCHED